MAEFQGRQRLLGESVEDFGTALQSLAAKAFPDTTADALEKMIIHQFISGMKICEVTSASAVLRHSLRLSVWQ